MPFELQAAFYERRSRASTLQLAVDRQINVARFRVAILGLLDQDLGSRTATASFRHVRRLERCELLFEIIDAIRCLGDLRPQKINPQQDDGSDHNKGRAANVHFSSTE